MAVKPNERPLEVQIRVAEADLRNAKLAVEHLPLLREVQARRVQDAEALLKREQEALQHLLEVEWDRTEKTLEDAEKRVNTLRRKRG